jgi:glucose/mannose-6-phosphate isomerase
MSVGPDPDEAVLDDPAALESLDPGEMLRAVATAGAQVREALLYVDQDALAPLADDGRPRAVLVTGMGSSGIVGDIAAAVAGRSCPVPVLAHRGHRLPGWVGPMDVVIAVSCSGTTEETLASVDEAVRRGCRVVTVGPAGSPLAARAADSHSPHLAVDARGRVSRANLWGVAVPVLLVLDALGLAHAPRDVLGEVADELDSLSQRCGPAVDSVVNPAKQLALRLTGSLPYIWGSSELAAVAAARGAAQLASNAKHPAVAGALTEVHHNQVAVLAGRFGTQAVSDDDIFRDPIEDGSAEQLRMRIVLLRDSVEIDEVAAAREATTRVAEDLGVPVEEVVAEGEHPVSRLAGLVALLDFASVYLALLQGIDPTPVEPAAAIRSIRTGERR